MKIDGLRLVTRGAAPGARPCEGCGQYGLVLRECRIPWSSDSVSKCYWRDLCPDCIRRLAHAPALPIGP